ncbi:hypothetical protein [Nocardia sp. NPDC050435]|uniref:hypothetical protein n=1 Tax=Nocardia sp. NPDC050435 TaxID=3155040 RepID=UPI0033ED239C
MGVWVGVVDSALLASPGYRALIERLQQLHPLQDSRFDRWLCVRTSDRGVLCLVAARDSRLVGFLAGRPRQGHIALVGSSEPRSGVGSALIDSFARHAAMAGAAELTVVLDSGREGRWERRRFFEVNEFSSVGGSALHFARPIPQDRLDRCMACSSDQVSISG